MPDILTFRLYAPLAAMGSVAVGEQRDGWDRPARSAVMGLIAACLGLDRTQEGAHQALNEQFRLGLLIAHVGPVMLDFHSVQVPGAQRGVRYATRAEELAETANMETLLTRRAYRSDVLVLGVLLAAPGARWSLDDLAEAMHRPRFSLYFGRKSCPLGLPLAPRLRQDAPDMIAALCERYADAEENSLHGGVLPFHRQDPYIALDRVDLPKGVQAMRIERRRDALASRARWQFHLREEVLVSLPVASCS